MSTDEIHALLHDLWLRIHAKRFDDARPDSHYNGILRAQFEVEKVAREHGIDRVYDKPGGAA